MEKIQNSSRVVDCYDIMGIMARAGIPDLTDGIYLDGNINYEEAQSLQRNYLLDEIRCKEGSKILDIGCGNGTLLEDAEKRGAKAVGITLSPHQAVRGRARGLDVRVMNYKDIHSELNETFDGVIANGSMEHFVQPEEAVNGKQDRIYREMFDIVYDVLNPNSEGRFATTAIHFEEDRRPNPSDILRSVMFYPIGSDEFHFGQVLRNMGGYYPVRGQLERNAIGTFELEKEVDGTNDYYLTSKHWWGEMAKGFTIKPKVMLDLFGAFVKNPVPTVGMVSTTTLFRSWEWQFRPDENGETPTKLYRHTWKAV
jgi:cyclopropane fatty-acyl-phospholipid synthase-like methyltransferase